MKLGIKNEQQMLKPKNKKRKRNCCALVIYGSIARGCACDRIDLAIALLALLGGPGSA